MAGLTCGVEGRITSITLSADYPGEATGACCVGETCSVTTRSACTGTYQGDGTDCTGNPCDTGSGGETPTGACCTGSSCVKTTEAACIADGGVYQGDDTTCASNPCPTGTFPVIVG